MTQDELLTRIDERVKGIQDDISDIKKAIVETNKKLLNHEIRFAKLNGKFWAIITILAVSGSSGAVYGITKFF